MIQPALLKFLRRHVHWHRRLQAQMPMLLKLRDTTPVFIYPRQLGDTRALSGDQGQDNETVFANSNVTDSLPVVTPTAAFHTPKNNVAPSTISQAQPQGEPPKTESMRDILLALRAQQGQATTQALQAQPDETPGKVKSTVTPRQPLGRRVLHFPGFNPQASSAPIPNQPQAAENTQSVLTAELSIATPPTETSHTAADAASVVTPTQLLGSRIADERLVNSLSAEVGANDALPAQATDALGEHSITSFGQLPIQATPPPPKQSSAESLTSPNTPSPSSDGVVQLSTATHPEPVAPIHDTTVISQPEATLTPEPISQAQYDQPDLSKAQALIINSTLGSTLLPEANADRLPSPTQMVDKITTNNATLPKTTDHPVQPQTSAANEVVDEPSVESEAQTSPDSLSDIRLSIISPDSVQWRDRDADTTNQALSKVHSVSELPSAQSPTVHSTSHIPALEPGPEDTSPAITSLQSIAPSIHTTDVSATKAPRDDGEKPLPLRESTHSFLRSTLGVNSADIPIYRGEAPARFARAHTADAVMAAGAIFMAEQRDEDTPQAQGLLAHELFHALRTNTPRYIPPLLQDIPLPTDEEATARVVEAHIQQLAMAIPEQTTEPPLASTSTSRILKVTSEPQAASLNQEQQRVSPPHDFLRRGHLPAPWEPWPTPTTSQAPTSIPPQTTSPTKSSISVENLSQNTQPVLQRAEQGRALPRLSPQSPTSQPSPLALPPPLDLDALSEEVYAVLKRRLAAEYRRSNR